MRKSTTKKNTMRKNISSLLQRGNLTPKQRYLLIIQNDIEEARTGKGILTEADIKGLEGWHAQTNEEAREWNKYNEGWKLGGRAGIEAEFIYAETKAEHFRKNIMATELALYPFYREHLNALQALKKIKVVDIKEAIEITNKQREQKLKDGIDFDYAIYQLAFESLSDEIRKDILLLDPEAEYEPSYLEDEETIANLLNGKEELSKEAKEKYAELVADRSYNEFAKEYQLHGAFADLPIMDLAKKWAKDKGIKPRPKDYEWLEKIENIKIRRHFYLKDEKAKETIKNEVYKKIKKEKGGDKDEWLLEEVLKDILEDYARDNKTTIKKILKETLIKWLEEGLPYEPIAIAKDHEAYNGKTKLPLNELLKEWLKAKAKAREALQKLIDKSELKIRDRTPEETRQDRLYSKGESEFVREYTRAKETAKEILGVEFKKGRLAGDRDFADFSDKVITGESLYNFKGDYKFIKDFKERVDRYDANAGFIYADNDPEHKGDNLDKELLIAEKDKDGKPAIISIFGMSLRKLEGVKPHYFKEVEKNGETYLEFKSEDIEKSFKDTRQSLINGYAKLLAFEEIFKKVDKIYETDLTAFTITPKIIQVSEFIDLHNQFLDNALEDILGLGVGFGLYKKPLKTKGDLYINKDKIAPDINTTEDYGKKFYEILGDEYKY